MNIHAIKPGPKPKNEEVTDDKRHRISHMKFMMQVTHNQNRTEPILLVCYQQNLYFILSSLVIKNIQKRRYLLI